MKKIAFALAALALPGVAQAGEILACTKYGEMPPPPPHLKHMHEARHMPPPPHMFPPAPNATLICALDSSQPFYQSLNGLASQGWQLKTAVATPDAYTFYLERGGWGRHNGGNYPMDRREQYMNGTSGYGDQASGGAW